MRRGTRRVAAGLVAVLLGVTPAGVGSATTTAEAAVAPSCPGQSAGNSAVGGMTASTQPVVLVHGWTGTPMAETRSLLERLPSSRSRRYLLFDYARSATRWADDPAVASCLAEYVDLVSRTHEESGGNGIVHLVGHSMGGLAIRFALDPSTGGVEDLAERVGGVVTLDTPFRGSEWGGSPTALVRSRLSDRAQGQLPSPAARAWFCLAAGEPPFAGCATPPYLPESVQLHQVAGNVTLRRELFGRHAYDVPLRGDGIVSVDSQTGYNGSASPGSGGAAGSTVVECSVSGGDLSGGGPVGMWLLINSDHKLLDSLATGDPELAALEHYLSALLRSDCGHGPITTNGRALQAVDTWLGSFAADVSPEAEPSSAPTRAPDQSPTTAAGPTTYYLSQMRTVAREIEGRPGRCTGGCTGFDRKPAEIESQTFEHSYIMRLDSDGDRSMATFNALRACRRFQASIGLRNDSPTSSAEFTIELDGQPPRSLGTLATGQVKEVDLDMRGVYRFVIAAHVVGAAPTGVKSVWGDARLTCQPGSLDGERF